MSEIQLQNVEAVRQFTPTIHTDTYAYIAPPESGDLAGRSVFITGASKGIGRAAALSYARAGFTRIAVGARSDLTGLVAELREVAAARARTETGGEPEAAAARIVAVPLDVTSEDSVRGAVATIERELCGDGAGLDVLINNAGYLEPWVPVGDSDTAKWWRSWDVNVRGTYLVLQHCMPLLLRGTLRTNILTSSIGVLLPRHGASAYASAKFAVSQIHMCIRATDVYVPRIQGDEAQSFFLPTEICAKTGHEEGLSFQLFLGLIIHE